MNKKPEYQYVTYPTAKQWDPKTGEEVPLDPDLHAELNRILKRSMRPAIRHESGNAKARN